MTRAQFKQRIIDWVKSGVPKNIKSYNVRTLLQEIAKVFPDVENFTLGKLYAFRKSTESELEHVEINPVEYVFQELTENQQKQALENLGIKTVLIEGRRFLFYKKPGNVGSIPQSGDTAALGWDNSSNFTLVLRYVSGNPALFSSWINISGDNAATGRLRTPEWKTIAPNGQWMFPAAFRDDSFIIKVVRGNGSQNPNGVFWLGGYSGVQAGNQTMVICMEDSLGGTFAEVGSKYAFINQLKPFQVRFLPTYSIFPRPGDEGIIYVAQDTGVMYYWDIELDDYEYFGDVIYGDYINPTTFEVGGNPVTPDGTKLYIDLTTDNKFRWNGEVFLQINDSEGGGGVDWSNLTDQKLLKYDSTSGKPVDSKAKDITDGIEVSGLVKSNGVQLNHVPGTPIPNQVTRDGDILKYTNSLGVSKNVAFEMQMIAISSNLTLSATHHNAHLRITANVTITVPTGLTNLRTFIEVVGNYTVTFVAGSGVTLDAPFGLYLKSNNTAMLYWVSSGNYRLNGMTEATP